MIPSPKVCLGCPSFIPDDRQVCYTCEYYILQLKESNVRLQFVLRGAIYGLCDPAAPDKKTKVEELNRERAKVLGVQHPHPDAEKVEPT